MDEKNIQGISFTKLELRIAKYIFRHYKDRYTPRQLARLLEVNHAHANRLCSLLSEKGLLKKEDIGNSDYYAFNYSSEMAIKFMEYLISLEVKEFPNWLKVLLHSMKDFEHLLSFGCVFGSSIRIKNFNDIDVLLAYDKSKAEQIGKIKEKIRKSELVEKPIRYLDIMPEDVIKNKDDKVFYSILSECMVFSHAEKYAEAIKNAAN